MAGMGGKTPIEHVKKFLIEVYISQESDDSWTERR
jgi:hypothetical protein